MSIAASMMQCTATPAGPSEVQPSGKESEKLTTSGAVTGSQLENSVLPPFLPSNEIEDDNAILSSQVQSSWKLPVCETAEETSWPPRTHVLLLSTRGSDSGTRLAKNASRQFSFDCQCANSLETYYETTEQFMSAAKSQKADEVWIVHEIDSTANSHQPVIDGKILSENELYKPLYCRQDSKPIKLRVIYLLCPTESAEPSCSNTKQSISAASSDEKLTAPNHASLCNSEVHSLVFNTGVKWQQVRQAFDRVETSGKELTADNLLRQIVRCCGAPRSRRMSGVPSADCVATVACDSVDLNYTPPIIPDVPVIEEESALNRLHSLQRQPSNECVEPSSQPSSTNLFVSVVVGKYAKDEGSRTGFKRDIENFTKVAQCLGCPHENVHTLCPADGYVAADNIQGFVSNVIQKCKTKSVSPRCVFLAVSAHGNESGIRTSDGKKVPVGELLLPLASLGGFVQLFYQACRGSWFHAAQAGKNYLPAFACSLGFASPETAGCILPSPTEVPRAAAIFASMVGYEAYRNELDGSWMPRALLDVVSRPGTFSVKQLGEMVQARLQELKDSGIVSCRRSGKFYTAYIQTQYSANEGSENFGIETGLSSGTETAEAGHSAAAEELAQLELNKPSQPD